MNVLKISTDLKLLCEVIDCLKEFSLKIHQNQKMINFIHEEMMVLCTYFLLLVNNPEGKEPLMAFQKIIKLEAFLDHQKINHFCLNILKETRKGESHFGSFYLFKILDFFSKEFSAENVEELNEIIQIKGFKNIELHYLEEIKSNCIIKN
eukprot:gene10499-3020_t